MEKWKYDLKESTKYFNDLVKPVLTNRFGFKEIIPVEGVTESVMANKLDESAGVDHWLVLEDDTSDSLCGLASRNQWGNNWRTFTVRKTRNTGTATEYAKRKNAIKKGYIYPRYTCQAYIDKENNKLLSLGLTKTKDLMGYIEPGETQERTVKSDGNVLFVIKWDKYQNYTENFIEINP